MEEPKILPNIPPEYTTVAVILRSFKGVQAANNVLHAGKSAPSPIPTITRSIINSVGPPIENQFYKSYSYILIVQFVRQSYHF